MAGALPAKKGRPEREAGERVAAHAMTTKPPDAERVAVWKREMSEAENAEFEEAAGLPARRARLRDQPPREDAGCRRRSGRGLEGPRRARQRGRRPAVAAARRLRR